MERNAAHPTNAQTDIRMMNDKTAVERSITDVSEKSPLCHFL